MEKCSYPHCNTILSRFNPYGVCYVHQKKILRERLPMCLRKELQGLEALKQEKQPVTGNRYAGLTQGERKQIIYSLSELLKDCPDEELIEILKNPEEVYESLLSEDKDKAEGFSEAVIFLREKEEEILQEFLRRSYTAKVEAGLS